MCFSASASFVASAGLATIGVASFRTATKRQRIFAIIPFLFAIQQLFEGFQWLAIGCGTISTIAQYGFLFFAFLFWPVYVPFAVLTVSRRNKKMLRWLLILGILVALFYFVVLLVGPTTVAVVGRSIRYHLSAPYYPWAITGYFVATCGAFLLSGKRALRWFGSSLLLSAVMVGSLYYTVFISVWCFFGAILSTIIYLFLRNEKKKFKFS